MRLNVYAEELTDRVEVVSKSPDNHPNESFKGIRMYLASPDVLHSDPNDDDSSAITIWVPWTKAGGHRPDVVTNILYDMIDKLNEAYGIPNQPHAWGENETAPLDWDAPLEGEKEDDVPAQTPIEDQPCLEGCELDFPHSACARLIQRPPEEPIPAAYSNAMEALASFVENSAQREREPWRRAEGPELGHVMGPSEFGGQRTCTKCGRVVVKQLNGAWEGSALTRECGDVIDRKAAQSALEAAESIRRATT